MVLVNKELRMASPLDTPVPAGIVDVMLMVLQMHMVLVMHMLHVMHIVHVMQMSQLQSSI